MADYPDEIRPFIGMGVESEAAAKSILQDGQADLFSVPAASNHQLSLFASALTGWSDVNAARVLLAYHKELRRGRQFDPASVMRWSSAHQNEPDKFVYCLQLNPPDGIEVLSVMPKQGAQKIVFSGIWRDSGEPVVLKKLLSEEDKVLQREQAQHPIGRRHPNIIETLVQVNGSGERFLVETRLDEVLDNEWRAGGLHRASTLLYDMAAALTYIHETQRVHGDVKPDNIGRRNDYYLLLDFGLCRVFEQFVPDATPRGSLRTRAPELIVEGRYINPTKADIWSLGATVFNSFAGRFPLLHVGEEVPDKGTPERNGFENELCDRITNRWDEFVTYESVPEPLGGILAKILERDPLTRLSATDLRTVVERRLAPFLRSVRRSGTLEDFPAYQEFRQVDQFLWRSDQLALVPLSRAQYLLERFEELSRREQLQEREQEKLRDMLQALRRTIQEEK